MGTLIVGSLHSGDTIATYKDVLELFKNGIQTKPEYLLLRKSEELRDQTATTEGLLKDKDFFTTNLNDSQFEDLTKFLKKNKKKNWTYEELMQNFVRSFK